MTGSNDIGEYEQKHHFELTKAFADEKKAKLNSDEADEFSENFPDEYWAFVEQQYFSDMAYYDERICEMMR